MLGVPEGPTHRAHEKKYLQAILGTVKQIKSRETSSYLLPVQTKASILSVIRNIDYKNLPWMYIAICFLRGVLHELVNKRPGVDKILPSTQIYI